MAHQQRLRRSELVERLIVASSRGRGSLPDVVVPTACNRRWTLRLSREAIIHLQQLGDELSPAEALRRLLAQHLGWPDAEGTTDVDAQGHLGLRTPVLVVLGLTVTVILAAWLISRYVGPDHSDSDAPTASGEERG